MSEAKPQFDPSKPFQSADQGSKPKFDPSQPWDAPTVAPRQSAGVIPTIVDKFAQGGSLGFADEISGAGEAAGRMVGIQGLGGKIKDMKLADDGPTLDFQTLKDAYVQGRDKDRTVLKQEGQDHPYISGAAELAGTLINPVGKFIPGGAGIKGAAKTGAMLGGAAGLGYSNADNVTDLAKDTATGAALGGLTGAAIPATIGAGKALIGKGSKAVLGTLADKIGASAEYTPIANKEAVVEAADKLGLSLPKAVLTDNPSYQKLESGLSQSGSIPAQGYRKSYNDLFKGLDKASEQISDLKTPQSDFAIGKGIQQDLASEVHKLKAPTSELYNEIMPELQKIPVDESVVNKTMGQLKKQPIFQTKDGKAFLEEHADLIKDSPELASLKEYRSSLGDLTNQNSLPVDVKRVDALQRAVTKIRDNSIEAQKAQFPKSGHAPIDDLIDKLSLADASHASNVNDINSIKSIVGNKDFGSPTNFLNKLGDMKESDIAQRAANLDVTSMNNLKDKFPSIYEQAKMAKVNDLIQSSTNPTKGFSDQSFLKKYSNLDPEMKDLLFDKGMQSHIDALQTVKSAIPDKLGPSGTPEGQMVMDMFSPRRNAMDFGIKKVLQNATPAESSAVQAIPDSNVVPLRKTLSALTLATPSTPPSSAIEFQKAADKNKPTKGPEKWANDGLKNIQDHDSSAFSDPAVIEQILGSKKGKDLLIRASDLKPNTKAMDKIVEQIKSASMSGGE